MRSDRRFNFCLTDKRPPLTKDSLRSALVGNIFLKNLFARPRPCRTDTAVQLLIPCSRIFHFRRDILFIGHRGGRTDSRRPWICLLGKFGCGIGRFFTALSLRPFSDRCPASVILGDGIGTLVRKFGGILPDRILCFLRR